MAAWRRNSENGKISAGAGWRGAQLSAKENKVAAAWRSASGISSWQKRRNNVMAAAAMAKSNSGESWRGEKASSLA